jgi:hypothetical protein
VKQLQQPWPQPGGLTDTGAPTDAMTTKATRLTRVLINRDYGASYSMSAMSGVVNTPCDVGSAVEIVGVALANSDDPMIVRCAENVLALSTVGV